MIGKQLGASVEAAFLRSFAEERYQVEVPTDEDLRRAAELVERYADLPLGGTDALVVATAERLRLPEVGSLDHRISRSSVRPMPSASGFCHEASRCGARVDSISGESLCHSLPFDVETGVARLPGGGYDYDATGTHQLLTSGDAVWRRSDGETTRIPGIAGARLAVW